MPSMPITELARISQISAGVGKRYQGASLGDFTGINPPDDYRQGVYIHGLNNTGKTHLAAALIGHYRESSGVPSYYLTAHKAVEKVHNDGILDEGYMYDVDLLVVDDITALHRSKSGYEFACIAKLLDARFQDNKGTIVTANKQLDYWAGPSGNGIIWRCLSNMAQIQLIERHA